MHFYRFIFILFVTTVFSAKSQDLGLSAYSRLGLGDIVDPASSRHLGMGSAGTALYHNFQLNSLNPAALGSLKYTNFEFMIRGRRNTIKTSGGSQTGGSGNIQLVSLALPLHKNFAIQLGARPFSSVSYGDSYAQRVGDRNYYIDRSGSGGLSEFFLGAGYNYKNWLLVGVNGSFVMGQVSQDITQTDRGNKQYYYLEERYERHFRITPGIIITREIKGSSAKDYTDTLVKVGDTLVTAKKAMVSPTSSSPKNWFWGVGITGTFFKTLQAQLDRSFIQSTFIQQTQGGYLYESYSPFDTTATSTSLDDYQLPTSIRAGISFYKPNHITFALDYMYSNWSNYTYNNFYSIFGKQQTIAIGTEYTPDYNSIKYYKRITYRAGLNYTLLPYKVVDQDITDLQATLGGSLVFPRTGVTLNLALAYGQRGTTAANLVKENYFQLTVGVISNNKWFIRRRHE